MQLSLLFDMPIILYRSLLILIFGLIVLAEEQTSVVNVKNQDDEKIMLFVTSKSAGDDVTTERANIDERQARMSLHTESPRAKVRREQAFRNTLVARRRKIQRNNNKRVSSSEVPTASATSSLRRSSLRRRPVQRETIMGDLLEMQESQNGLYVTVPEQHATNDTHEIVIETLGGGSSGSSTTTSTKRNSTTTTKPYRGSSSSTTLEHRGKKIVAMPASLYNHFRPVESNIPIEDMSQFLYFGQKLRGTGMGKDISSASPSPKKLLAGFEDILDDEMNSVDRTSSSVSKSTKMRTTSFREQTTRPACPDKEQAEARGNSINSTNIEKNSNNSNLSLRIVVTESTTLVPINTTINTRNATIMGEMVNTTSTTTIQSNMVNLNLTEDTPKATIMSRGKHHHYHQQHVTEEQSKEHQQKQQQQQQQEQKQKHQEQRATLRNSETQTSTTGAGIQGPITSSSQATAIVVRELSTGATVELSTTIAAAAALAPHAQPSVRQEQRIQQPGFTIRWTDTRPSNTVAAINKRRRLAAASRRRDKSARNMDNFNNSTTTTTTAPTTTSTATSTTGSSDAVPVEFPVTPKIISTEITSSTTMNPIINSVNSNVITSATTLTSSTTELPETTTLDRDIITTTIGKMLDPSEVQKMYRAGSTSQPELSTTTITTTGSPIPSTEIIDDVPSTTIINTSTTISASTTASTTTSTTVRSTGERSPEVRARNLADKAKDDVLPIMQLYNTSTMFNASESPLTTTTTSTTSTVLPTELIIDTTTPTATTTIVEPMIDSSSTTTTTSTMTTEKSTTTKSTPTTTMRPKKEYNTTIKSTPMNNNGYKNSNNSYNKTKSDKPNRREFPGDYNGAGYYPLELNNNNINNNNNISSKNRTIFEPAGFVTMGAAAREPYANISEVISRRHDGDALASQETVAVVSYILATLVVFPIAVGVALILRRLILRNRKVLEESDTSSEISCRKDALNLENGDFKMSIEKTITKLPRIQHLCHEAEKPPPPTSQESRWEFPRDKLRLQTVLGEGNFGQVWKAEADDLTGHQGTTRLVAVKTVKEGASDREKEDLVRELEIMQRVGSHPNVVTLLGCCTEQEPHYLILEYVMYGKLLAYLRDHRTRQDFYNFSEDSAALTSRDLTVFGYCVARGMEYLASKKIIHRDLAARNVLVDHNKLCKIADFGMSRFANEDGEVIETRHGRNALPIRWMAPESLIYSLFTTKTDVWSFGILMWEIVTLGSTPYPDMTAREVMRSVQSGYRLERPSHCRSELFRIIARCWQADPDRRPEFQVLRRDLAQLLEDNMNGHYVDLESFASECTD